MREKKKTLMMKERSALYSERECGVHSKFLQKELTDYTRGGGGRGDGEADRNGRSQLSARYRAIHINASSFDGREGRSGTYFNF